MKEIYHFTILTPSHDLSRLNVRNLKMSITNILKFETPERVHVVLIFLLTYAMDVLK